MKESRISRSALVALVAWSLSGELSAAEPGDLTAPTQRTDRTDRSDRTDRTIRLDEAVRLSLAHNEAIVIQREALAAADAALSGAHGAYDPQLSAEAAWRRSDPPVNSSFSGAGAGRLAPTSSSSAASVALAQLLPTGATVALRALGRRDTTDGRFALLSPAWETQVGVELRQPLLRNRVIDPARLGIRVAASARAGESAELARELTDTVAEVERAYWTLFAARREVEVREEAVRLAEEQLAETEARIETGMAPETEIAQPRSELERRRGELFASREAARRSDSSLKRLVLSDDEPERWSEWLVPEDEPGFSPRSVDLGAAMASALATRPELARRQATVERRRLESALSRDALLPALDAVVSYDRYGLAGDANPAAGSSSVPAELRGGLGDSLELLGNGGLDDARVALVLSLPLGNRAARSGAAIAASAERQAEAELARARKSIRAEVLDAAAALETAGQRIEAARAARDAALVQLDSERSRYGAGLSTNFLVLTRQNDLSRARLDEIAAQTDYRRAETALARVTGNLLAERGIELAPDRASTAR